MKQQRGAFLVMQGSPLSSQVDVRAHSASEEYEAFERRKSQKDSDPGLVQVGTRVSTKSPLLNQKRRLRLIQLRGLGFLQACQ